MMSCSTTTTTHCALDSMSVFTVKDTLAFEATDSSSSSSESSGTSSSAPIAINEPGLGVEEDRPGEKRVAVAQVPADQSSLPPIPKLYIPKSLILNSSSSSSSKSGSNRSSNGLPQHKRKMVDGIMNRLCIGERGKEPTAGTRQSSVFIPRPGPSSASSVFASKIFRKRCNSAGHEQQLASKIQVIDNGLSVPGALPTPFVKGSSSSLAVFRSEACDTVLRKYSTSVVKKEGYFNDKKDEQIKLDPIPSPPSSSPLLRSSRSFRPDVKTPPLDDFFRKPRTVAEKRLFLLQSPIEYKVMDFESTVYHLIKKLDRFRDDETFRTQVELLMYGSVPTNRNIWKAVLWLNGECNQFLPWRMNIDGEKVRLMGATGTLRLDDQQVFRSKVVEEGERRIYEAPNETHPGRFFVSCCMVFGRSGEPPLKNEKAVLEQLEYLRGGGPGKEASRCLLKKKRSWSIANLKPGPLSTKVKRLAEQKEKQGGTHLGPFEIYELPVRTFTATPQVNKPLPKHISSYLKRIVPEEEMTTDWLNYSLSVLKQPKTQEEENDEEEKENVPQFHFSVPYKNNQNKIIVRRKIVNNGWQPGVVRNEEYDRQMEQPLTFQDVGRQAALNECDQDGILVDEVQEIVGDMINSVTMSFAEDSFIRTDPDLVYPGVEKPIRKLQKTTGLGNKETNTTTTNQGANTAGRSRLLAELARLNVSIINTAKMKKQGE